MADILAHPTSAPSKSWPGFNEADWMAGDFRCASDEILPNLKLHYITLGTARRDAAGRILNAALLLSGTSGSGKSWLQPHFAEEMFGPGQPLDLTQWYVVLPDAIGRGRSSKPSDGLKGKFAHYRYIDLVTSEYQLLTRHLGIEHLKLLIGGSMGGMHAWMFAGLYPGLIDLVVPMACQPVRISGRNWINRRVAIEAIRNDPDWNGGDYTKPPQHWCLTYPGSMLTSSNVQALQHNAPDVASADALYRKMVDNYRNMDANDVLYSQEAAMDYNPEPLLPAIRSRILAINSADDGVNAPELNVVAPIVATLKHARFVMLPAGSNTPGHRSYEHAALWKAELSRELLALQ